MTYLRASEVSFRYPVLSFTRDGYVSGFANLHNLTQVVPSALKKKEPEGMELIDSNEKRWVVRSIRKTGRAKRWTLLDVLLFDPPNWRVEYELEELPPIPLDEIKERAIASERAYSFGEYEAAGEQKQFEGMVRRIRGAPSVARLFRLLLLHEVQFI